MLNAKTILFGLSIFTAGLAPTVEAQAYSPTSQTASEVAKVTLKDAADDFNDWFDSLTDTDKGNLQFCFDKMLDKLDGLGPNDTLGDLQDILKRFAKAVAGKVGGKIARDLFSQDLMSPVYFAATTSNTSDWLDAIEDAHSDYGWDLDDAESYSGGTLIGPGIWAIIIDTIVWMTPSDLLADSPFVNTIVEGDNDGDGQVDTDEERISSLD